MRFNKFLSIAVFLCLLGITACGEKRAIIVRASDSSQNLIRILMKQDPDSKNRNHLYAVKFLGKRRERSAVPILIQTTTHYDSRVVRHTLTALGKIGQEHPDLRQTISKAITPFLSHFETRDTAERALFSWEKK